MASQAGQFVWAAFAAEQNAAELDLVPDDRHDSDNRHTCPSGADKTRAPRERRIGVLVKS